MTESGETENQEGGLIFLTDPAWQPTEEAPDLPLTATIGAWLVTPDGNRGLFQPNPLYLPSTPDSPLDPVDAVLGLLVRDESATDLLLEVLADVLLGIALDDQGLAIVRNAPDGVPSVLVTTSYGHRDRVPATRWRNVTLPQLAAALPAQGVDILLNPGAPTSMRVLADTVRSATTRKGS